MSLYTPKFRCRMCGAEHLQEPLVLNNNKDIDEALDVCYLKKVRHSCQNGDIGVYEFIGLYKEPEPIFDSNAFDDLLNT